MLKISEEQSGDSVRLVLEGRLVGPWVEELGRVCTARLAENPRPHFVIDLCGVTSMDADGQELLHELLHRGAVLNCSDVLNQYLVELMTHSKRKSQGACRPCHYSEVKMISANGRY